MLSRGMCPTFKNFGSIVIYWRERGMTSYWLSVRNSCESGSHVTCHKQWTCRFTRCKCRWTGASKLMEQFSSFCEMVTKTELKSDAFEVSPWLTTSCDEDGAPTNSSMNILHKHLTHERYPSRPAEEVRERLTHPEFVEDSRPTHTSLLPI